MARPLTLIALIAAGTLATGCAQTATQAPGLTAAHNPSVYSVHQPVVQRTDFVLDLAATDGLAPSEAGRLQGWLQGLQLGYGDRVWVDEGMGYGSSRTRHEIAAAVQSFGLLLNESAPVTPGAVAPGAVRVVVSRMTASVPTCPDWADARRATQTSGTHSNYGCAINSNLAAMIADPADLVLGQAGSPMGDANETSKAVKSYRNRIQTGVDGAIKSEPAGGKK